MDGWDFIPSHLQEGKLRFREGKWLAHHHTVSLMKPRVLTHVALFGLLRVCVEQQMGMGLGGLEALIAEVSNTGCGLGESADSGVPLRLRVLEMFLTSI